VPLKGLVLAFSGRARRWSGHSIFRWTSFVFNDSSNALAHAPNKGVQINLVEFVPTLQPQVSSTESTWLDWAITSVSAYWLLTFLLHVRMISHLQAFLLLYQLRNHLSFCLNFELILTRETAVSSNEWMTDNSWPCLRRGWIQLTGRYAREWNCVSLGHRMVTP